MPKLKFTVVQIYSEHFLLLVGSVVPLNHMYLEMEELGHPALSKPDRSSLGQGLFFPGKCVGWRQGVLFLLNECILDMPH